MTGTTPLRCARPALPAANTVKDSMTCVQRDKLASETDLKLLAKWDPKRYGDRMALTGAEGGAIQIDSHVSADQAAAVLQEGLRALVKPAADSE